MVAALSTLDVLDELATFLDRDASQRNSIGAFAIQVPAMEAVGLGLASDPLSFCVFLGEDLAWRVVLDLVDPTRSLVLHLMGLVGAPH